MHTHFLHVALTISSILLLLGSSTITLGQTESNPNNTRILSQGNTLYVGGFGPQNYTTIQAAIDNASDTDTVYVYDDSSPYYENIIINKQIQLIGENRDTTIIDGNETGGHLIQITVNYVYLTGFTVQNSGGIPNAA